MVLQADNVTYAFADVVAMNDVTLSVAAGQCVALVGESGAGKTTLLRCSNRIVPSSGPVQVEGIDFPLSPSWRLHGPKRDCAVPVLYLILAFLVDLADSGGCDRA